MSPPVGQPATLTVSISPANGSCAGFYLTTDGPDNGTFTAIDSGTTAYSGGVTHTMPRIGSGAGPITFTAEWTATQTTGVQFLVYALACNDDDKTTGDGAGSATLAFVSGCAGMTYYIDQDGDGYGSNDSAYPIHKDCMQPLGYAPVAGDCDDFTASVHPGAPELCDGKDNNCNGQIDEGVVYTTYCADKDGDGHGVPGGATKMDCKPSAGFGDCGGDCNDGDASIYPGAMEICNGKDDNCNGQIDEGVRMTCGLGWCRRYATGCTSMCIPGPPTVETCNAFDDDCDGVIDNGTDAELCGASGLACVAGRCVAPGATGSVAKTGAGSGSGTGTGSGTIGTGSAPAQASSTHAGGGCSMSSAGNLAEPEVGAPCLWFALALVCWLRTAARAYPCTDR